MFKTIRYVEYLNAHRSGFFLTTVLPHSIFFATENVVDLFFLLLFLHTVIGNYLQFIRHTRAKSSLCHRNVVN